MRKATSVRTRGGKDLLAELDRHWVRLVLLAWVAIAAYYLWDRWGPIRWLALGDTDDNMRLMQVRGLLGGQRWFDLRQYRLNPPAGFDIHWSRIVDLPIAGLILVFRLFTSNAWAERLACGLAPLLPLSVAMLGVAATVRRLVAPLAWPVGIAFLLVAPMVTPMFMPERIDHHGWQLAMLGLTVAGLCDPRGARGGALVGAASAVSLAIGLEMLPYCAMAGGLIALRWVWDRAEAIRLQIYGLTLAGASAAGFAAFASDANRALRCDALTPVWLSVVVLAGALLFLVARWSPPGRAARLALAVGAGAIVAAGFALVFPQCLGRPEQVSPELARNWLNNVKEAKPIYQHPLRIGFSMATLPVIGLLGAALATWRARRASNGAGWAAVTLFCLAATLMLLWQVRAGPAAQLLALPGAVALAWWLVPITIGHSSPIVRVLGTAGAVLLVSGSFVGFVFKPLSINLFGHQLVNYLPPDRPSPYTRRVNRATGRCMTQPALGALNRYPAQTVFTFTDLGPRLIVLTHHSAVAGPYHRNGDAILDVQHAFGRSPAEARAIMRRHGAGLLLVCPNMAESTIYRARDPGGFYSQLAHGKRFAWLTPLALPRGSPLRLFRID